MSGGTIVECCPWGTRGERPAASTDPTRNEARRLYVRTTKLSQMVWQTRSTGRNYRGPTLDALVSSRRTTPTKPLALSSRVLSDLAWDFMMDMMHAVPGVFGRHYVACMQGKRKPAKPKWRTTWTDKKNYDLVWEWEKCCKDLESWKLTEEEGKAMDARSLALAGDPSWIRSNVEVFSGKGLTSHDWFQLVLAAGEYIFAGLYPNNLLRMEAIFGLITCVQAMLKMQSPFDVDDRAELNELKLQVVSALVECEAALPRTELPVMLHLMAHVPDAIYRWNQVRNFWCFFSERSALSFYYLYELASARFGLRRLTPCMFGRTSA